MAEIIYCSYQSKTAWTKGKGLTKKKENDISPFIGRPSMQSGDEVFMGDKISMSVMNIIAGPSCYWLEFILVMELKHYYLRTD